MWSLEQGEVGPSGLVFLDALISGEMRRMLLLTRPSSVADVIDIATELSSPSSVRAVTGSSTEGASELETRIKFLELKFSQLFKAVEKGGSKKGKSSDGEEGESPTCWSCGEQGHV